MILCSLCDFPDCGENGQKPVMFPTFGDTLPSSGLHLALSATATRLQLGGPAMLAASAAATLSPVPDRCTVCAQTVHVTDTVQGRGEPGGGGGRRWTEWWQGRLAERLGQSRGSTDGHDFRLLVYRTGYRDAPVAN